MASITQDGCRKDGTPRYSVQYYDANKQRKKLRIGTSRKIAERVGKAVDALVTARICDEPVDKATARWLQECPDHIHAKLATHGLVESRQKPVVYTLGTWLTKYVASRVKLKPNTLRNYAVTRKHLIDFFGEARPLESITPGDCDEWVEYLKGQGLNDRTISREIKRARQFMAAAIRKKLISENPLAHIKARKQSNNARQYFITRDEIETVLGACPDAQWRAIVALARYGGFRTPSETLSLRWQDIDWNRNRILVTSPKTEHHDGGESRVIPLFPELRPYLQERRDEADPADEYVITRYRSLDTNLGPQLSRIIRRAGLKPWPKVFQNLRASRQTELTRKHPLHVVCAWIGNSELVAKDHYLGVTDDDYTAALSEGGSTGGSVEGENVDQLVDLHNPAPESTEVLNLLSTNEKRPDDAWPCSVVQIEIAPPRGVEPLLPD